MSEECKICGGAFEELEKQIIVLADEAGLGEHIALGWLNRIRERHDTLKAELEKTEKVKERYKKRAGKVLAENERLKKRLALRR